MTEIEEEEQQPVQVFIMMGQSNMLGFGTATGEETMGTLEYCMKTLGKYKELKDNTNNQWFQSTNVRYTFVIHSNGKAQLQHNDWLTVGKNKLFGPEVGFGRVLGSYYDQQQQQQPNDMKKRTVLLLKVCIGNRSLGWDLLPPGSPRIHDPQSGKVYAGYKDTPSIWDQEDVHPAPVNWYGGKQYDDDVASAKDVLKNLGEYVPGATTNNKYEIVGFVWWQGHKDTYNEVHTQKYEENLVRLIHVLRLDFQAPKAKFVLATLGHDGDAQQGNFLAITNAQLAVSGDTGKYPFFKGNVKTVDARPFWRSKEQSPLDQHMHYNQNGETVYEVGKALGEAMVELLQ
jgi:Carbohydrate esterase, sialic acid-specific acetylesterase